MWVGNTFFQKQNRRLYTWKSPGDIRRNQIDYIMCNKRYKNGIKDVQTYPGADINSDHCLLVAKTKFKLKNVKKGSVIEQYDLSMLKEENIRCQYALEVKNRYAALIDLECSVMPQALYVGTRRLSKCRGFGDGFYSKSRAGV